MLGVTDVPSSLDQDQLLESSKMKSNAVKLVLTYQSQCHSQCFHSQATRDHSTETWTSTARTELNSSLNGRPSQLVGKKMLSSPNWQPLSPPLNDVYLWICLLNNHDLFINHIYICMDRWCCYDFGYNKCHNSYLGTWILNLCIGRSKLTFT